jgi:1-acyl-sn-glycerol-3-phosphate acyltransferase
MGARKAAVNFIINKILNVLCKIDTREVYEALSNNSPMIVIFNHVNFIDAPVLVTQCYPINMTGLAKAETWDNPFLAFIFSTYKAIPIDRKGAFSSSFKKMRRAIENGFFMCIAPEGTRSKNGVLQHGKAGMIQLALEADIPILPVAHHGGENIWKNMRRFRRTPMNFKAGRPFRIRFDGRPKHEQREEILSEVMGQMARLLPLPFRGPYAQQAERECKYLDFI